MTSYGINVQLNLEGTNVPRYIMRTNTVRHQASNMLSVLMEYVYYYYIDNPNSKRKKEIPYYQLVWYLSFFYCTVPLEHLN